MRMRMKQNDRDKWTVHETDENYDVLGKVLFTGTFESCEKYVDENMVVGFVGKGKDMKPVTRAVLKEAFEMVEDKENWKNPVRAEVSCLSWTTLLVVKYAVTYFTGSVAKVKRLENGNYLVTAPGYYLTCGA